MIANQLVVYNLKGTKIYSDLRIFFAPYLSFSRAFFLHKLNSYPLVIVVRRAVSLRVFELLQR